MLELKGVNLLIIDQSQLFAGKSYSACFFKGYLRCKTITSQNVPSKAQIKNFFIL